MKRQRRLRKLVPDSQLIRRRAAGEALRDIARDYDVAHTTLLHYYERPEVAREIKEAEKQLRAEQRALAARRLADRRLEQKIRKMAREQAARERDQARRVEAASKEVASRRRRPRSDYEAWLDERDQPVTPFTRADRHSQNDEIAARVVADGGGMQEVIDATELHTLEDVVRSIDPAILAHALDNDVLKDADPPLA